MSAAATPRGSFPARLSEAWGLDALDRAIQRIDDAISSAPVGMLPGGAVIRDAESFDTVIVANAVIEDVEERILAGGEPPADLGAQLRADTERRRADKAQMDALKLIRDRLVSCRTTERRSAADRVLSLLKTEHEDLLKRGKAALDKLGVAADAEQAVKAGKVAEWRAASEIADTYAAVRGEQITAMAVLRGAVTGAIRVDYDTETKEICDTIGTLRDYRGTWRTPATIHTDYFGGVEGISTDNTAARPWLAADRMERLRWVIDHSDDVWLPTPEELDEAGRDRRLEAEASRVKVVSRDYPYTDMSAPGIKQQLAGARDFAAWRAANEAPSSRRPL